MLHVRPGISIPLDEIEVRATRSSGPGGQHANVTASRVEVSKDSGGSWLARHAAEQQAQQWQQGSGSRPGQHGSPDGRSRTWQGTADSGDGRPVPTGRTGSAGVDVRV